VNILGHPYIAFRVNGRVNKYLAAGSHLPDIFPFASTTIFSFEEIHEGGERLLNYLNDNYPDKIDLAIGMIAHSVKYGADKFNPEIEDWLLSEKPDLKEELAKQIVDCSSVDIQIARKARLHNYLWAGIDLYVLKNEKVFVKNLAKAHSRLKLDEISTILSKSFLKDKGEVKTVIDSFFSPLEQSELLLSVSGLVRIWKEVLAGLPEKDRVSEEKTIKLFNKIYYLFEDRWEEILDRVAKDVELRMKKFI